MRVGDAFEGYAEYGAPPQAWAEIDAWWDPRLGTPDMARLIRTARDPARLREVVAVEIRAAVGLTSDAFELPPD